MTLFETGSLPVIPATLPLTPDRLHARRSEAQRPGKNVETGRRRPAFLGLSLKRRSILER